MLGNVVFKVVCSCCRFETYVYILYNNKLKQFVQRLRRTYTVAEPMCVLLGKKKLENKTLAR